MGADAERSGSPPANRPRLAVLPTTELGWWAVALAAGFFGFVLAGTVVPRGVGLGFVCGFVGGVAAATAIVRDHERALTVFAAAIPVAIAVAFVLTELITGTP